MTRIANRMTQVPIEANSQLFVELEVLATGPQTSQVIKVVKV